MDTRSLDEETPAEPPARCRARTPARLSTALDETTLSGQSVPCARGFYCAQDLSGAACWGSKGEDVLVGVPHTSAGRL